ncbi:MAG: hypothetical protein EVA87_01810 [Rhodospirillaceae bacterium]|nr:MAG: hypothetical protein EVA87_01810 [Rhodospirillaceae bacterium]
MSSGIDAPPDGMSPGIGHTAEIVTKVTEALSAETLGNPGINVLATPCLAGLCDEAAAKVCGDRKTRRMRVDIRHLAATAIGDEVRIEAEIMSVDAELVVCRIKGRDSNGDVVSGHVIRVVD